MTSRRKKDESTSEVDSFENAVPDYATFNVPLWVSDNGTAATKSPKDDFAWSFKCPWGEDGHEATIKLLKGGQIRFKCGHPLCIDRTPEELTTLWPPKIESHFSKWYQKEPGQVVPQDPNYKSWVKIKALGYSVDGTCWYQCSSTGHVTGLKPEGHAEGALYGITPDYKYWLHRFGRYETGKIDWRWAARTLIEECHYKGIYDPLNTRGTGIYFDRGRLVINAGTELIVDGKPEGIFDFDGEYLYESNTTILKVDSATDEEMATIRSLAQRLPFVDVGGPDLTIGMVFCGFLAGILKWRPHAWLLGPKGSGKSEILRLLITGLSRTAGGRYHKGRTTAPGVMQGLHNSATLITLDEQGEVNSIAQNERIQGLIQMARNSSTSDDATEAKGGAFGKGSEYMSKCCFIFASIFHSIEQPQDKDRFCFIKVQKSQESKEAWPALEAELIAHITTRLAAACFWRVAQDAIHILSVVKSFVEGLAKVPANDRRDCDQWGTVLGVAWWVAHPGIVPTQEEILDVYAKSRTVDHIDDENESNFGEIAIKTLLSHVPPGERISIGEAVGECAMNGPRHSREKSYRDEVRQGKEPNEGFLQRYGIRVETNDDGLLEMRVGRTHEKVKEVMRRIGFPNYVPVLLTYPGTKKVGRSIAFNSVVYSGYISVPLRGLIQQPEPVEGWEGGLMPRAREVTRADVEDLAPPPFRDSFGA